MEPQVKVISLVGQYEDGGNLWFGFDDPETPTRLYNYIKDNMEEGEPVELLVGYVKKSEFDREEH